MARLGDCATIFELSFAVNAILPSVLVAYRKTQENVAIRFAEAVKKYDPTLSFGDREMHEFLTFVRRSSGGLRISDRAKWIPICAFALSLVSAFLGLLFAAATPESALSNPLLWVFSIYCLVFCPALGFAYEKWLQFVERLIIIKWANDPDKIAQTAVSFKLCLQIKESTDELKVLMRDVDRKSAELEMEMIMNRVKRALEHGGAWIRSLNASARRFLAKAKSQT